MLVTPLLGFAVVAGDETPRVEASRTEAPVTALVSTRSGEIITGSQLGVRVFAGVTGQVTGGFGPAWSHVHDLAVSPNGELLLVAGGDPGEAGGVEARRSPGWELVFRLEEPGDVVYRVSWSPDGQRIATANADGTCSVWDATSRKRLVRFAGHSRPVLAIGFLPDGETVVSGGADETIQCWEAATGRAERTLSNHVDAVLDLAVQPRAGEGSPLLVTASADRTVRFWHPKTGRMIRFVKLPSVPEVLTWTAEGGRVLVGCRDGHLRGVDPNNAQVVVDQSISTSRIQAVTTAGPDGVIVGGEFGWRAPRIELR